MGAEAHPVDVRTQIEEGGLRAELTEEGTLGLSGRGGTGLGWLRRPPQGPRVGEGGGLDSAAVLTTTKPLSSFSFPLALRPGTVESQSRWVAWNFVAAAVPHRRCAVLISLCH